ncbi:MAG: helix-turn-helix domain-containing protein [Chloroflexota bacterium]|nr:helix-turn-helix domain-containing protein [Chloroflexota bacterium]
MELPGLRRARQRRVLTQADLARLAGLSKTTVNLLEQGRHPARVSTVRKLAEALDAGVDELLSEPAVGEMTREAGR